MIAGVTQRRTFEKLREEGVRVRGRRVSLTYASGGTRPHVAYAIPRKVGGAVVRNRARRRIHAVLAGRARAGSLPAGTYLVHVPAAIDDLDHGALQGELDRLLDALAERIAS